MGYFSGSDKKQMGIYGYEGVEPYIHHYRTKNKYVTSSHIIVTVNPANSGGTPGILNYLHFSLRNVFP